MLILGEDAAEPITSAYAEADDPPRIGDRRGQRAKRTGVRDDPVRPVYR